MMKTATVRDLRYDFPKVEAWVRAGEQVVITKRSKPVARLGPPEPAKKVAKKMRHPDYLARVRRIFGSRVFTAAEVEEMRAFETGEP